MRVITTVSNELAQLFCEMVSKKRLGPGDNPFTWVTTEVASTNVPDPDSTDHWGFPIEVVCPFKVTEPAHTLWSVPATAGEGGMMEVICTVSLETGQAFPGLKVYSKRLTPTDKLLALVENVLGEDKTALLHESTFH